jgi:hypothetical protein
MRRLGAGNLEVIASSQGWRGRQIGSSLAHYLPQMWRHKVNPAMPVQINAV